MNGVDSRWSLIRQKVFRQAKRQVDYNNLIILPLFNLKMNYRANRIQQVYLLLRCSR